MRLVYGNMLLLANNDHLYTLTAHKTCSWLHIVVRSQYLLCRFLIDCIYITYYLAYLVNPVSDTLSSLTAHETGRGSVVCPQLVYDLCLILIAITILYLFIYYYGRTNDTELE